MVTMSLDATSRVFTVFGSRPSATTRTTMSRSVSVPTSRLPSTTGARPTFSCFSIRAAYSTVWSASIVHGFEVIASLTLLPMCAPFLFSSHISRSRRKRPRNGENGRRAAGGDRRADSQLGTGISRDVRGSALGRLPGVQGRREQGVRLGRGRGRRRARDDEADSRGAGDRAPAAVCADGELRRPLRLDHGCRYG